MSRRSSAWRLVTCALFLTAALSGLGARLGYLHLGPHESIRARLDRLRSHDEELLAGRGRIFDRNGGRHTLALNLVVKDVCADPVQVRGGGSVKDTAIRLSELLDVPADTLAVRLSDPGRQFAYIKRFVRDEEAKRVEDLKLPGIFFREATMRHYPQGSFMCHVLGFVNYEGVGSAGIEQQLDQNLRGSPGLIESHVDGRRQELYDRRGRYIPAIEGADVFLTLDQNIQYIVENALLDAVRENSAKGGWALIERVKTGEILAMASVPGFDLNAFTDAKEVERLNRVIGCVYEPGSTFKPTVIAAALNEGTVTPDQVFDCENGAWQYCHRTLRDYHPYDRLTVADGIKKSSNILTAKVALTLGDRRLHRYLTAFGIGLPSGIDLPGEERGLLSPASSWRGIKITRVAIGQGVAVTALQMLGVMCAIANDGVLMRPYVVRSVYSADGTLLYRGQPEVRGRPVSPETAALMRRLLSRATEEGGTGTRAIVDGYQVAGKTGTAQKAVGGGYSDTAYVSSFVGFLPADSPEIGVIVVLDEPQPYHTGGRVAAPAFSRIAGETVRYLGVPPSGYALARTSAARRPAP